MNDRYVFEYGNTTISLNNTDGMQELVDDCKDLIKKGVMPDEEDKYILGQVECILDWENK